MIAGVICHTHGRLAPADIYTYPSGFCKCKICGREYMSRMRAEERSAGAKGRELVRKDAARVYAIHQRSGLGVDELVALPHKSAKPLWAHWGFTDHIKAGTSLRQVWAEDGLPFEDETTVAVQSRELCSGCAVRLVERTRGCKHCSDRHRVRKNRGYAYVSADGTQKNALGPAEAEAEGMEEAA